MLAVPNLEGLLPTLLLPPERRSAMEMKKI
jgi:hypothetical protein